MSFEPVAQGSNVNLTAEGSLDWVHWGLETDTTINRKATVTPRIGNFTLLFEPPAQPAYRYTDNYNGYSWADGTQTVSVTNTPTGVYFLRPTNDRKTNGFQFTVPASTETNVLKVYVGTYALRGKFQASLSDHSAPAYSDSSLSNAANGPGVVYIVTFAANSPGQSLTITWTADTPVNGNDPTANVTLQAAALSAPGADNPPFSAITGPAANATFATPASIAIDALALDADGAVTNIEFFAGTTKLGEVNGVNLTSASLNWSNAPPGDHVLRTRVTDDLGVSSFSAPVEIFVNATGGFLFGSVAAPPPSVDLTVEGALDWIHWGLLTATDIDRKSGVTPRLGSFTKLGTNVVQQLTDSTVSYSWTDGIPTLNTNTRTGVYIYGITNGFEIQVPAATNAQALKVYVSLYGAQGNLQAFLSDFSAPAFTDTSPASAYGNSYAVYSVSFASATPGQTLTVRWTAKKLFDQVYGNVSLLAATLAAANPPPTATITTPTNGAFFPVLSDMTIAVDASSPAGAVGKVEFFENAIKLGETTNSPYTFAWSQMPAGQYALTARVTDTNGAAFTSLPVNISVLSVLCSDLVLVGDSLSFSVSTQPNRNYSVEFTDSLDPANWQPLTNFAGTGNATIVMDTNAPVPQRFYRVIAQ